MKTLLLSKGQTGLVFYELKRCASKNAVFRFNKKLGQAGFFAPKSKIPPKLDQTIRHAPKIARICNFIADSKSLWAGLNMNTWLSCCNMPWQKVMASLTAHTGSQNFGK